MADQKAQGKSSGDGTDQAHPALSPALHETGLFEIHVKGQLSSGWSDWLEHMEVKLLKNGEMILFGPVVDQAALLGVLNKLSSLNLAILAVNEVKRKNGRRQNG